MSAGLMKMLLVLGDEAMPMTHENERGTRHGTAHGIKASKRERGGGGRSGRDGRRRGRVTDAMRDGARAGAGIVVFGSLHAPAPHRHLDRAHAAGSAVDRT